MGLNLLDLIKSAMSAKKQLGDEFDRLSEEIARLRVERKALEQMPAPREDVKRVVMAHLDRIGKPFIEDFQRRMLLLAREPQLVASNSPALANLIGLVGAGADSNDPARARAVDSMMMGLLSEYMGMRLVAAIDGLEYEEGVPLATRAAEIDKVDARIAALERQFGELKAQADAAGISF